MQVERDRMKTATPLLTAQQIRSLLTADPPHASAGFLPGLFLASSPWPLHPLTQVLGGLTKSGLTTKGLGTKPRVARVYGCRGHCLLDS